MKILIMSYDNNSDIWEYWHTFTEKYWPDHPEIFYLTEKLDNPYYKTIKKDYPINQWTKRVREACSEIDDDRILIMIDDIFIFENVDTERLLYLADKYVDNTVGNLNIHRCFDNTDIVINDDIKKRSDVGKYKCSVMCSIWWKDNLIKVFSKDLDPWNFEKEADDLGLNYYIINSNSDFLKYRNNDKQLFGIHRGQWTMFCIDLFKKFGIDHDFSKRGIYRQDW